MTNQIDINNFKPSIITRIGFKIDMVLAIYRQSGLKELILFIYRMTKISLFKIMYRHCRWYRNRIHNKVRNCPDLAIWIMLLNMFNSHDDLFDTREMVNAMKDEDKEKWREHALEGINNIISQCNITDGERINNLYKMYGLEK